MIIYEGTKTEFLTECKKGSITKEIKESIWKKMGRNTPESEFHSWENSLEYMSKVLEDDDIPNDAGIAVEYNIPQTSKRVDFIISGYGENNDPTMIILELKQWDKLSQVDGTDALVDTFTGGASRKVVHPSYQAWSYAQLIRDYNASVQDENVKLYPCVYMHNYIRHSEDPLDAEQYQEYLKEAPVFTKGQEKELGRFVKDFIRKGDSKELLHFVDRGKIRPSKSLQNSVASMLKGNKDFIMIDEQKVAYEEILRLSILSQRDLQKRTVIVQGGPGTGKSVIAVNLLAELTLRGQAVQYVSKNSAPREVYSRKLKGIVKKTTVDNLFKGSGNYTETRENAIHTLLADEAHRLNEKSGMYHNRGENQIKEIIHAALCSVFFIDEGQRVTMEDIGSVAEIKKWAEEEHSEIHSLELHSQFRCGGSDGYLSWLDHVLDIKETADYEPDDIDYDIRVLDSPNEVRELVIEKDTSPNHARMLAGYCWEWVKEEQNNSDYHDIKINEFEMSWNLHNGEPFAISDTSINEVGCIHTYQGLEFDYVGIIIGDDMKYENGKIKTDFRKRARTDQSIRGIAKLYRENKDEALKRSDEIIKNTYRTLLSRGMKGCYIYCVDSGLEKYLKERVANIHRRKKTID